MGAVIVEGADVLRTLYKEIPPEARELCMEAGIMKPEPEFKPISAAGVLNWSPVLITIQCILALLFYVGLG